MVCVVSSIPGRDKHSNIGKLHTLMSCGQFQPILLLRAYPGAMGYSLLYDLKDGVEGLVFESTGSQCSSQQSHNAFSPQCSILPYGSNEFLSSLHYPQLADMSVTMIPQPAVKVIYN